MTRKSKKENLVSYEFAVTTLLDGGVTKNVSIRR